jgi:dTDP-4-dehydrorhamnose 3,5-epimerase-like enzyme
MSFSIISGGIFNDDRGSLSHVNDFDMERIKCFYVVENSIDKPKRAWQGHKFESKWFYVVKGSFMVGMVQPDNWDNPSKNLKVEKVILNESQSNILHIPGGYANGIESLEQGSKLLVFSDFDMDKAATDNIKFDINTWPL